MSQELRQRIASRRRIYLLRHGEVSYFDERGQPYPQDSVPLNPRGKAQANAAAEALREAPIDRIIHTGMPRTRETAEIVARYHPASIQVCEALREITPGPFARAPQGPAFESYFTRAFSSGVTRDACFLSGETFGQFQDRVLPAFRDIVLSQGWKHLLLVAHGGTNRMILLHALQTGLESMSFMEQEAGCINVLDLHESDRVLVRQMNFTPHSPLKADVWATTLEQIYLDHWGGAMAAKNNRPEGNND